MSDDWARSFAEANVEMAYDLPVGHLAAARGTIVLDSAALKPIHWLAPDHYGPRKRRLPIPGQFWEGDVLRVERTGENMLVLRDYGDPRGAIVKRARGAARAQPIRKGDRIIWIGSV